LLMSFVVLDVLVVVPNSHQYPSWHSSLPEKTRKEERNHSLFCGLKLKNKKNLFDLGDPSCICLDVLSILWHLYLCALRSLRLPYCPNFFSCPPW
jgi:hypothetical protein